MRVGVSVGVIVGVKVSVGDGVIVGVRVIVGVGLEVGVSVRVGVADISIASTRGRSSRLLAGVNAAILKQIQTAITTPIPPRTRPGDAIAP